MAKARKINKTAKRCSEEAISLLIGKKVETILLKKHYTADLEEMKKLTRLEDAITRAMDNIRRAVMEDVVRR